jgi:hypothetical protein
MNNPAINSKTNLIIQHAHASIRDDVSRHLSGCHFSDPDDPTLNALVVQALLAGQPIKLVEHGGAAIATEIGLARLGDRMENTAWSLARMKTSTVLVACLLCSLLGAGSTVFIIKKWSGTSIGRYLGLSTPPDTRIALLDSIGATLRVKNEKETTYVYFTGNRQPKNSRTESGVNYLYFTQ